MITTKIIIVLALLFCSSKASAQNYQATAIPDANNQIFLFLRSYCDGGILQWQTIDSASDKWQNIDGATINNYPLEVSNENTSKIYRAILLESSNATDTVFSYPFRIKVVSDLYELQASDFYDGTFISYNSNDTIIGTFTIDKNRIKWSCKDSIMLTSANPRSIGSGLYNTIDVVNQCGDDLNASSYCLNLEMNGFSDWFLPSEQELGLAIESLRLAKNQNIQLQYFNSFISNPSINSSKEYFSSSTRSPKSVYTSSIQGSELNYGWQRLNALPQVNVLPVRYLKLEQLSHRCEAILFPRQRNQISVVPSTISPTIMEIAFEGSVPNNAKFIWDFEHGHVISGDGAGPYLVEYRFGGYNQVNLRMSGDTCSEENRYSETFQVELFSELDQDLPAIFDGSINTIDYNNDGLLDVFITGSDTTALYRNIGSSQLQKVDIAIPNLRKAYSSWADFDNDNDLDLLISGYSLSNNEIITSVFENKPSGQFVIYDYNFEKLHSGFTQWLDINNNGKMDILISGLNKDSVGVTRLYLNSDLGFELVDTNLPPVHKSSIKIDDFNRDNYQDLIIMGSSDSSRLTKIYKSEFGQYKEHEIQLIGVNHGDAIWMDINNDGLLDFYYAGNKSDVTTELHSPNELWVSVQASVHGSYYLQDENESFIEFNNPYEGSAGQDFAFASVDCGDYDNDGLLDLIVGGMPNVGWLTVGIGQNLDINDWVHRSHPKIFKNHANGFSNIEPNIPGAWSCCSTPSLLFGSQTGHRNLVLGNLEISAIKFADFNNDGKLDLIREGSGDSDFKSSIYLNNISRANEPPTEPQNLSIVNLSCDSIRLVWDKSNDNTTPQSNITYELYLGSESQSGNIFSKRNNRKLRNSYFDVSNLKDGSYYWGVKAVDNGKLSSSYSTESTFEVTCTSNTSEADRSISYNLRIFPNPFSKKISLEVPNTINTYHYSIMNIYGQLLKKGEFVSKTEIETSNLGKGIYFITIENNERAITRKVISIN